MTTLYLVRHGETVDNVNQILQGQEPGKLTENGIKQAEAVRDNMAKEKIDAFVSSDLKRAMDTAAVIAKPHNMKINTTSLLRERDWGDFTGKFIPDIQDAEWPENVETLEHMMARARNFLTYIKVTYPDKIVLAVGHGLINKAVQAVYYNTSMKDVQKMTNAEVRILML